MRAFMRIRQVEPGDFERLYFLGSNTEEFRVSATEPFMEKAEFRWAMGNKEGCMFLAEADTDLLGFAYMSWRDLEAPPSWGCLVYLVVAKEHRGGGIAAQLYTACTERAVSAGVSHIYALANDESDGSMIGFLEKRGFNKGHRYVWMDRKL
jgi:GNAT superfamily N-acetyltransferase